MRALWSWIAPEHFARNAGPSSAELGRAGERLAARWLEARGWRVKGRNLRTAAGEIDLVVQRGPSWWCVEVKSAGVGSSQWGQRHRAAQHLDQAGWRRRRRSARAVQHSLGLQRVELVLLEVELGEQRTRYALHCDQS